MKKSYPTLGKVKDNLESSVFFQENPATKEPKQESTLAPKHFSTKALKHQTAKAPSNQSTKDIKQVSTLAPNNQSTKAENNQTAKTPKQLVTTALKHFSSYLTYDSFKSIKQIALDTDRKDFEVIQEAIDEYLKRHK